jgi:hypothetical protein
MALSNLRTDWMFGTTYASERDFFIKIAENRELYDNPTRMERNGVRVHFVASRRAIMIRL